MKKNNFIFGMLIILLSVLVLSSCGNSMGSSNQPGGSGGSSTVQERYRFENKSSFTVKFYAGSSMGTLSPYPAANYWCTCNLVKGASEKDVRCEPSDKVWAILTGYNTFTFVDK